MNNYILAGVAFGAGAVVSGIVSFFLVKKRYDKRHQDEMDAVWKDIQDSRRRDREEKTEQAETELEHSKSVSDISKSKPDLFDYASKVHDLGYGNGEDMDETNDRIYEITENDLDDELYSQIPITLYADGLFADDQDYPMHNIREYFPKDIHKLMEYKDEIFIRNEIKKADYDIVKSQLTYGEMLDRHPEIEQRVAYDDALERYHEEMEELAEEDEE